MSVDVPPLVLYRTPARTLALLGFTLAVALYFELHVLLRPLGVWWLDFPSIAIGVLLVYLGLANVIKFIRRIPALVAWENGILFDNGWGPLLVAWADIEEFSVGNSRLMRVRLRRGARPAGSPWTRIMSTSLRASNTLAVMTFLAAARPAETARALAAMQARYLGHGATG